MHPGGPFWKNKDAGAWSIPKGEYEEGEDPLAAAKREFLEETGCEPPTGECFLLTPVKIKSGKVICAWAIEGYLDTASIKSNVFEMEWPPKSGKKQFFPEVDKGEWLTLDEAKIKISSGQLPFLDQLAAIANNK